MHKCEEAPRSLIEDVATASEQWWKLQKLYQNGGFINQHITVQELMSTSLSSCGNSVDTYAFTIQGKAKGLEKMNAKLPDWLIVSILLKNLGSKYKDFTRRVMATLRNDEPVLEDIIAMLFSEDQCRSMRRS